MQVEILYRPTYSLGAVRLAPNEQIRAEAGAMVSMSAGVTLETKAEGGLLKSLSRAVLGGESFFRPLRPWRAFLWPGFARRAGAQAKRSAEARSGGSRCWAARFTAAI